MPAMTANNEILMGEKMGISNTPNVKAQEEAHHHLHHHQCHEDCHDKNVIGHTILPFFVQAQRGLISLLQSEFEPSKSDTTPKLLCDEETSRVSQQRQGGDHRTSSSSSPTVLEPSDVSSMTSTSRQFASALPFRLRQQTMHIPTMIVVRMNGATVDSGNSTNDDDAQLLSEDSNDASSSLSTTDTTIISNAISTFSSWIQPNQKPLSSSDGVTTTSSNDQSSTFSSWVRPDSPMVSKNGAAATTTAEGATLP